jgi:hypothetical protein
MELDPERIAALEASVDAQCSGGTYDLDENLMLLKLYQFFPEKATPAAVAKVLLKALMHLPETDFLLCTYLIPERIATEAPVLPVVELANRLETCAFSAFWEELVASRELVKAVVGFDDVIRDCARPLLRAPPARSCSLPAPARVRSSLPLTLVHLSARAHPSSRAHTHAPAPACADILGIVALTYQVIDLAYLAEILNLGSDRPALERCVAKIGSIDGDKVRVKLSDDNQAKVKEPDDAQAVRIDQLTKAIRAMPHAF